MLLLEKDFGKFLYDKHNCLIADNVSIDRR